MIYMLITEDSLCWVIMGHALFTVDSFYREMDSICRAMDHELSTVDNIYRAMGCVLYIFCNM